MHWFEIVETEFFRDNFLNIFKKCRGKPIVVTCKYKYTGNDDWYTFLNIKPYTILKTKNENDEDFIFCKHININKSDIENYMTLTKKHNKKEFIIIANIHEYITNGVKRLGLKLFLDDNITPIMMMKKNKKKYIRKSLLETFYWYKRSDFVKDCV